jgi:ribonuclease R
MDTKQKLKENVISKLRESSERPLSIKDIARKLGVKQGSIRSLKTALKELSESGELVQTRGKRFGLPEHMNLIVGALIGHSKGYGFVRPLPRSGQTNLPDIYIHGRDINTAMHGDKVIVRVASAMKKAGAKKRKVTQEHTRGEIIRVLERAHDTVVGLYEEGRHFGFVIPSDERITHHVYVDREDSLEAEPGQIVVAELTEYPSHHRNPEAKITEVLGWPDTPGLDTELLIHKHGLAGDFPRTVLKAVERLDEKIPDSERQNRADLRNLPMVTIDPADAKDFDDAVSLEITAQGNYLLGVHIADVSHYVTAGDAVDDEAYARATSIYLEDRVLPMLPERLSNQLCSLRENEDRLAMSVKMEIDPGGRVIGHEIFDSIICVDHRLTYDQAFAILEGDQKMARTFSDVAQNLQTMNTLARMLRAKRMEHGSLDFNFPEAKAIFDNEGEVIDIVLQKHNIAHELIEEFMLIANETVARHITARNLPMLYRIHEEPDREKMEAFRLFIASLGYTLSESEALTPRGLQGISQRVHGQPEEKLINYLLLRSLKEARYSPENAGHFGLACDCYTHFTSPIRRYPDLVVHRILRLLLTEGPKRVRDTFSHQLEPIAEHCSIRERQAVDAERESLETKQLQFMSGKVGDEFEGIITGVQAFGLFVELTDFLVEGLVHVSDLDDDYYIFMEDKHCLIGENTGNSYRLGDKLKVQVVRVNIDRRRMDFILADNQKSVDAEQKPKQRTRRSAAAATGTRATRSKSKKKSRGKKR